MNTFRLVGRLADEHGAGIPGGMVTVVSGI